MSTDKAYQILGIGKGATKAEIRKAWMRQVMRYHPDRPGGCAHKLMLANLANDVLLAMPSEAGSDTAQTAAPSGKWWKPRQKADKPKQSKPKASVKPKRKETGPDIRKGGRRSQRGAAPVPTDARSFCQTKLISTRKQRAFTLAKLRNSGFYVDPGAVQIELDAGGEHVASRIEMDDRWILFVVDAPMQAGLNAVALPTGNAEVKSTVISFEAGRTGGGRMPISDVARKAHFPWADKVEIAFRAG